MPYQPIWTGQKMIRCVSSTGHAKIFCADGDPFVADVLEEDIGRMDPVSYFG